MDRWDEGDWYEGYMGRWSRPIADKFLAWLDLPPQLDWLDVGCGTGALTGTILRAASPGRLAGVDPSAGFIEAADNALGSNADLQVGDAQALPFDDSEFDVVVSGLALNFVPDPGRALTELRRVAKAEGTISVYVWDYAEGMEMIRTFWDVAVGLDPSIVALDESNRFPLCDPDRLEDLFEAAGLRQLETTGLVTPTVFPTFDDFWTPLLGGQGPAPSYVMSLAERDRNRLKEALTKRLSPHGGELNLSARAWAIKALH